MQNYELPSRQVARQGNGGAAGERKCKMKNVKLKMGKGEHPHTRPRPEILGGVLRYSFFVSSEALAESGCTKSSIIFPVLITFFAASITD